MKVETPKEVIRYRKSFVDKFSGQDQYVAYIEWFNALELFEQHVGENYDYEIELLPSKDEDIVVARATVTLYTDKGAFRRQGIGVGIVVRPEAQYREMAIKGAEHDALKRALLKFGIGRDLYEYELTTRPDRQAIGRSTTKTATTSSTKTVKPTRTASTNPIASTKINGLDTSKDSDEIKEIVQILRSNQIAFNQQDLSKLRVIEVEDIDTFTELYETVQRGDWKTFFQLFHAA